MVRVNILFLFWVIVVSSNAYGQRNALVFQSDFGLKDGAVAAMKGVAFSVSDDLRIFDVTHEIPAFNIWEAAYRLNQSVSYWPAGTVFVSIIDPGVGSSRRSIVAKMRSGHFVVTPDNGTLTLLAESLGIEEVREIDETKNRLKNSEKSYTFHGRDVYAYTGARLAAGVITFEEVGGKITDDIVKLPYQKAVFDHNQVLGNIPVLDVQYGNVWTNIDRKTFQKLGIKKGGDVNVKITRNNKTIYEGRVPFANTFAEVPQGKVVGYLNSLLNFSIAINAGNFAERHKVGSGPDWIIILER
ncbi:MAG TPA: S-adenosyl-l-methionine hydroxide adenosyltransferase family protein [Chryseolinea sp.]|nr:S-adenosyl-l-methionine hydroxide adenosyltransferase family protein [Chryseolinea sp.]